MGLEFGSSSATGEHASISGRLYLLPNGDVLVAESNAPPSPLFLENLHSPFGMALVGTTLYVANSDAVVRFPYVPGQTRITTPAVKVVDLPPTTWATRSGGCPRRGAECCQCKIF